MEFDADATTNRDRIPISSQRGSTCIPDTFFTILEFSDATKGIFAELQRSLTATDVERLSRTHANLRTNTFGVPFQTKKQALSAKNIRNLPLIAHVQRSKKRISAYSSATAAAAASLAPTSPPIRRPSTNSGEGNLAHNLITSVTVPFGSAPTGRGCFEVDIETYGRNILQNFFKPSYEIYRNPAFYPEIIIGIMIGVELPGIGKHMFGLFYNEDKLCLADNNIGFLHEIREDNFMLQFLQAYNAAPDKTNIDTIEIFFIPRDIRVAPYEDLEFFFHVPATGYIYGIDNRLYPVGYVSTLFLAETAPAAPVGPAGGAGRPMNESNTRKSRKKSQRLRRSRRSRRAEFSHHSFKRK